MNVPQTHHGVCVADIETARRTLATIGYTDIQPNAPEPLVYADTADDEIGRLTCPDLGSPYRTHYVENPTTGHQIDLIEIDPGELRPRPDARPLSGDLTVSIPLPGVDPERAAAVLTPLFGDRFAVADEGDAWATLHIAASTWEQSRSFLTDVVGVALRPIGTCRFTVDGVGGRVDIEVADETILGGAGLGKKYEGANHLRFLHRDLQAVDRAVASRADVRWLIPPTDGFAFIAGPAGETIELFDDEITPARPEEETT